MNNKASFSYSPIHFRSSFSLLNGCLSPKEICRYARGKGFPCVGITDINNLYGLPGFIRAARQEGIKPIAGAVIRVGGTEPNPELFTAYINNPCGFSRLCAIISRVLMHESPYIAKEERVPYDPVADLLEYGWEGLNIASANTAILHRLAAREKKGLFVKLVWGKPYRGETLWAREHGFPLLAVNDAILINESGAAFFNLLRAMDLNTTAGKLPEKEKLPLFSRAATGKEMESFFSAVPDALVNARLLTDQSDAREIITGKTVFPMFKNLSGDDAFALLSSLCEKGVARRYGSLRPGRERPGRERPEITRRLAYELSIIKEKSFSGYFLVVHDIVSRCPRTCGRGSSASSIVSYLLGITHIDPLKYNLFFERFLNPGRKDPPDIDVDFPWDERNKVLEYVFRTYPGRSGMVANHVTFGSRSSIREPAKALDIPDDEIKNLLRLKRLGRGGEIPAYLSDIAARLRGFPHYIGLHCGGVVITPGPITNYTHVQPSLAGYPVIAWEKEGTEDAGLVKIDLLGNRSLAVLRDTISLVEKHHRIACQWDSFSPLDDEKTQAMIREGRTTGIFYIESPATRQLLKKMKTGDFEHLIIASSIIRPAANRYIKEYVKRLHSGTYTPLHPRIAATLCETLGIMVYQEDVSRVAIDLCGFSIADADALRKIISKKDREHDISEFRERFFKGGRLHSVPDKVLTEVWNMILSFKGYSFCKAHSASYALVSYKLACLKIRYPLEFMTSVINNGGGFYSRQTYINELKRLGYRVAPPDVTKSEYHYSAEAEGIGGGTGAEGIGGGNPMGENEGTKFVFDTPVSPFKLHPSNFPFLRIGLSQIRELDSGFAKQIIAERKKAPFADFCDFLRRMKPGLPEIRILIRSGALDSLAAGLSRPALFWLYFNLTGEDELFLTPRPPGFIRDYPDGVKLRDEASTLGIIISQHPLSVFSKRILRFREKNRDLPLITSVQIPDFVNRRVCIAGLLVTGKEVITSKNEMMTFVSFEDPHSIYETVFFPRSFRAHFSLLDRVGVYLISGKVEEEFGVNSINVDKLVRVNRE